MKTVDFMAKWADKFWTTDGAYAANEMDEVDIIQDILSLDLTGQVSLEKDFGLRAAKDSEPVWSFSAIIRPRCTVGDLLERSAQPIVINWQNSHRQGKKETLEAANNRLSSTDKTVELSINPLNERERREMSPEQAVAKINGEDNIKAAIAALEAKLRAAGIDPNAAH